MASDERKRNTDMAQTTFHTHTPGENGAYSPAPTQNFPIRLDAGWIQTSEDIGDVCPVFRKIWTETKPVIRAVMHITSLGIYEACLNGNRISPFVLAPGWTDYDHRLQVQEYDITPLMHADKKTRPAAGNPDLYAILHPEEDAADEEKPQIFENELTVTVGKGWFSSPIPGWVESDDKHRRAAQPRGLMAEIRVDYADGTQAVFGTDETWEWAQSPVRFSEIYDGEIYDASILPEDWQPAAALAWSRDILIPQEGEPIIERERILAQRIFTTPAGDTVVDFGQEVTGYVEFTVDAHAGDRIHLLHGEVLDRDGNFYNENYRSAKAEILYTCREGLQTWHPRLTFFGFRYIKLESFPGTPEPDQFTAIAVYSAIRQTGRLSCGNPEVNQLFSNIFWGQRGNFLDIPTDCPQRDERLGWTGDAQVFVKTASYNYDVERFFRKWLHDMASGQTEDGGVGQVVPNVLPGGFESAAWGDAAVICPWQIYLTYGDPQILADQFECMRKWVDGIAGRSTTPFLWTGTEHFGDWLGLDAPAGSYKGSSRDDLIASAFYAYSTSLFIKAGKVLNKDMTAYEEMYEKIRDAFRAAFPQYLTQTEHVLALQFDLAPEPEKTAEHLAQMIREDGTRIRTGFVGTPYILHVLTRYGYADLAWDLFLRKAYPSWLYSVSRGATTIWEHWDGIMEDGSFWSRDMNSFNHYAYGSVADWIYEKAAGICLQEDCPGFSGVVIEPHPDRRLGWLDVQLQTRRGRISSKWTYTETGIRFEIETAVPAEIRIGGKCRRVGPGFYTCWES